VPPPPFCLEKGTLHAEPEHAEMTMVCGVSAGGRPTCQEEPIFLYELAEQAVCRGREWQEANPDAGVSPTNSVFCPYTIYDPMQTPPLPGGCFRQPAWGWVADAVAGFTYIAFNWGLPRSSRVRPGRWASALTSFHRRNLIYTGACQNRLALLLPYSDTKPAQREWRRVSQVDLRREAHNMRLMVPGSSA